MCVFLCGAYECLMTVNYSSSLQVAEKEELLQVKERELVQTQQQLRSSEAVMADFQKTLQQRHSQLETLRSKVNYFQ